MIVQIIYNSLAITNPKSRLLDTMKQGVIDSAKIVSKQIKAGVPCALSYHEWVDYAGCYIEYELASVDNISVKVKATMKSTTKKFDMTDGLPAIYYAYHCTLLEKSGYKTLFVAEII